jgi:hypothetical protein
MIRMGNSVFSTEELEMGKLIKHSIPSVTTKAAPLLSLKQSAVKYLVGIPTLPGQAQVAGLGPTRHFCLHYQAAVFRLPAR